MLLYWFVVQLAVNSFTCGSKLDLTQSKAESHDLSASHVIEDTAQTTSSAKNRVKRPANLTPTTPQLHLYVFMTFVHEDHEDNDNW